MTGCALSRLFFASAADSEEVEGLAARFSAGMGGGWGVPVPGAPVLLL